MKAITESFNVPTRGKGTYEITNEVSVLLKRSGIQTGLATDASPATKQAAMAELDKLDNELVAEQRAAAQPRAHHFELVPVQ